MGGGGGGGKGEGGGGGGEPGGEKEGGDNGGGAGGGETERVTWSRSETRRVESRTNYWWGLGGRVINPASCETAACFVC